MPDDTITSKADDNKPSDDKNDIQDNKSDVDIKTANADNNKKTESVQNKSNNSKTDDKASKTQSSATEPDNDDNDDEKFNRTYVEKLRAENKDRRLQAKEYQEKAEEAERRAEEALRKTQQLQSAYESKIIRAELKEAAIKAGLIDMDAFKMVDTSSIKLNKQGEVIGVNETIETLKKNKPYLFKESSTSSGASTPPVDITQGERPTYKNKQEFNDAVRKMISGLSS